MTTQPITQNRVRKTQRPTPPTDVAPPKVNLADSIIFIHIPKTAGATIGHILKKINVLKKGYGFCHKIARQIIKKEDKKCIIMSVVRNPYDRLYSIYEFYRKKRTDISMDETFKSFILNFEHKYYLKKDQFNTCYDFLTDEKGELMTTDIIKFENLELEYDMFCTKYGLTNNLIHLNKNNLKEIREDWDKLYDEEMIKVVNKIFYKDFETFNYSYLGTNASTKILTAYPSPYYKHFVHYMEYLYWCTDEIICDSKFEYILIEPKNKSECRYCKDYKKKLLEKVINIRIVSKYNGNGTYREYKREGVMDGPFILEGNQLIHDKLNWFPNDNSGKIKEIFVNASNKKMTIGLVNRHDNRILENYKEICHQIEEQFKIKVDVTEFEDKSFEYQINFFNEHKIIISPHGAQLCSIPFAQDDSLIIECVHEEWHPYYYFPGLSHSSNKIHVMICDEHTNFPHWSSKKYIDPKTNRSKNSKLNINTNIKTILSVIDDYLSGIYKRNICYLK